MDLASIRFTAEAVPLGEDLSYGSILPFRFEIKNDGPIPLFIERVEALQGWRRNLIEPTKQTTLLVTDEPHGALTTGVGPERQMLVRNGLLLPGQALSFELPYRILRNEERLLITLETTSRRDIRERAWLRDPNSTDRFPHADDESITAFAGTRFGPLPVGETLCPRTVLMPTGRVAGNVHVGGALAEIPGSPAPFDKRSSAERLEAWTFSRALEGFILRFSANDYRLQRESDSLALPHVPFSFIDDLDLHPEGVDVIDRAGDVTRIDAAGALEFLGGLANGKRKIVSTDAPGPARYEVRE